MSASLNLDSFPELDLPERILLGPGPSMVSPEVRRAMGTPVIGHLDPRFVELMDRIQALLRYAFQVDNPLTLPVSGTGSAAMEASVANLVEPGTPVLVCINGYFGGRLAEMARRYGGEVVEIHKPWGQVFTPDDVQAALSARPARVVALVHGETSSGALQPLDEIIPLVQAQNGLVIVDAVASLAGTPLDAGALAIDVCYSGSQKCLSAPPGLGPITLSPRAQEALNSRRLPVTSWYLDLTMVQNYWGRERVYHHTAPISALYALYAALRLLAQEGLEGSWQRHRQAAERLWEGLEKLGLELHVPLAYRLPPLTTVRVPPGVDELAVRRTLLQEHNIEIAGGLGELKGKVWRIGLMGHSAQTEHVDRLLHALAGAL
jgi:alanine-glyoxylate transaminase / serine-glyoxylate transaminase / serine-pyruvate transaminase